MSALASSDNYYLVEKLVIQGDLSQMSPKDRLAYYKNLCESEKLNPLTKPFEYIKLNGKLTLYATKNCAEQLRNNKGISIYKLEKEVIEDVLVVTAYARDKEGREDISTGAVSLANLKGDNLANAYLKAETKAKRRVTLSLAGLGMLDESEISSIPNAEKVVNVDNDYENFEWAEKQLDHIQSICDDTFIYMFIDKLRGLSNKEELTELENITLENKQILMNFVKDHPEFQNAVKIVKALKQKAINTH